MVEALVDVIAGTDRTDWKRNSVADCWRHIGVLSKEALKIS